MTIAQIITAYAAIESLIDGSEVIAYASIDRPPNGDRLVVRLVYRAGSSVSPAIVDRCANARDTGGGTVHTLVLPGLVVEFREGPS